MLCCGLLEEVICKIDEVVSCFEFLLSELKEVTISSSSEKELENNLTSIKDILTKAIGNSYYLVLDIRKCFPDHILGEKEIKEVEAENKTILDKIHKPQKNKEEELKGKKIFSADGQDSLFGGLKGLIKKREEEFNNIIKDRIKSLDNFYEDGGYMRFEKYTIEEEQVNGSNEHIPKQTGNDNKEEKEK